MARLIEMPKLSPTMEEGQIVSWSVGEGDTVDVDDLLAEVETDKATMEFRSFDRGVVLKILVAEGGVVRLGEPVAIIGEQGEDVSSLVAEASSQAKRGSSPPKATPPPKAVAMALATESSDSGGRVKASPYVRKLAREGGIDLRVVAGSGPGGRIVARDLSAATAAAPSPSPAAAAAPATAAATAPGGSLPVDDGEAEVIPLSMMRKAIARRLTESKQTVPHFYLHADVNAAPLVALRSQLLADLASVPDSPKISFNDLIIKAVAIAIERVPAVNAQFTPDAIVRHRRIDLSIAVAIEDGLVTPVIRQAQHKGVLAIGREMRDLASRAKRRKLTPEEMTNGTFSISNLGMYGIDSFAAVINPPEGAILAVGAIRAEPVLDGDAVVAGRRMALTLSCDHRVVDGAVGASFLQALRQVLEHPGQILLC